MARMEASTVTPIGLLKTGTRRASSRGSAMSSKRMLTTRVPLPYGSGEAWWWPPEPRWRNGRRGGLKNH